MSNERIEDLSDKTVSELVEIIHQLTAIIENQEQKIQVLEEMTK